MIIFYDKNTGNIVGTIEGRVHPKDHLNMWVGSRDTTERIVCQWKPENPEDENSSFYPDHEQKDIFKELDQSPRKVYKYKVNLETKKLESK